MGLDEIFHISGFSVMTMQARKCKSPSPSLPCTQEREGLNACLGLVFKRKCKEKDRRKEARPIPTREYDINSMLRGY